MWKIITYSNDFFEKMIDMTIENYGTENDISNADFIMHEYFENPVGDALISLAYDTDNGVLAGQYVATPQKFKFFDKEIICLESLNTLTRSSYRGQGVFVGLASETYNRAISAGFCFCYGAPNPNSFPGFIKKLGFEKIVEMPLFLKPLKPSQFVKEKTNGFLGLFARILNIFTIQLDVKNECIVKLTKENVGLMDTFWLKIRNKYEIIGVRNAEYIKFRYLNVPNREYMPYIFVMNNEVVAFAVARIRMVSSMTTGMIADFLFVDGFEKQAKLLIKFLCREIKKNGAGLSGCIMLSHCSEVKILKKAGFIKCPDRFLPQPTPLIIKNLSGLDSQNLFDIKRWFFTTGDYDVV